jgi:hypothetical protein
MFTRLITTVGGLNYALRIEMEEEKLASVIADAKKAKAVVELPLVDQAEARGRLLYDGAQEQGNVVVGNVDLGPDGLPMSGTPDK